MREKERKRDRGRERVRERVREKGGICEREERRLHEVECYFHQIIKTMKINFILRENLERRTKKNERKIRKTASMKEESQCE